MGQGVAGAVLVGAGAADVVEGLGAVGQLGDDLHAGARPQALLEEGAVLLIIIRNDHRERGRHGPILTNQPGQDQPIFQSRPPLTTGKPLAGEVGWIKLVG